MQCETPVAPPVEELKQEPDKEMEEIEPPKISNIEEVVF